MPRRALPDVVEVDELTIDGKSIRVRHVDMPLEKVRLDPQNPRIANTIHYAYKDHGGDVEKRVEELLWRDDDVKALHRQILLNRGLIERIIVREDGTVVEGNCRTLCYRKLREEFPEQSEWRTIPARVLPSNIGPRDVSYLLGEMHVAGKNAWSPFEKAAHVYRMHKELGLTQDEIARLLRMSKSKINQMVRAFELMKSKFFVKYPEPGGIRKYSYFEELFKKPELREWVTTTPKAEDMFVEWVGGNRIGQGVNVRELAAIVANPQAVRAMSTAGLAAARKVVGAENPAISSKLLQKMVDMTEALRSAQVDDLQRVKSQPSAKRIVMKLAEALDHFCELADAGRG